MRTTLDTRTTFAFANHEVAPSGSKAGVIPYSDELTWARSKRTSQECASGAAGCLSS